MSIKTSSIKLLGKVKRRDNSATPIAGNKTEGEECFGCINLGRIFL